VRDSVKPTLLVIDDSGFMRLRMKKIFSPLFHIEEAADGEEGLAKITGRGFKIDLVLLDINMPGMSGIDVLKVLNEDGRFKATPIIVFSGEEDLQLEALNNGAWDFVSKDEAPPIIKARVKNVFDRSLMNRVKRENALINNVLLNIINYSQDLIFEWDTLNDTMFFIGNIAQKMKDRNLFDSFNSTLDAGNFIYTPDIALFKKTINKLDVNNRYANEELRIVLESGEIRWCKFTFYGEFNKYDNLEKIVGIAADVNSFKEAIEAAINKAEHDVLTGLVTREAFENFYNVVRKQRVNYAMILIDVDSFKTVNDTIGHLGGDFVLKLVAGKLKNNFRESDCVARVGGDEFAVIMSDVKSKFNLIDKLDKLFDEIRKPFEYDGKQMNQFISVGVLFIPQTQKVNYYEAYKKADLALYESKEKGRNQYTLVEED
jgi:diguanylate cyclase (GGDEF)-like protein